MIKSFLPNYRWLTLASEHKGEDWATLSREIDRHLEGLGMDLAEETIFVLIDGADAQVARPVIGPKKNPMAPLKLVDWVAAPVMRQTLKGKSWPELWTEAEYALKGVTGQSQRFMLAIKRRLGPDLTLSVELLVQV